jgi:hypothetical protein
MVDTVMGVRVIRECVRAGKRSHASARRDPRKRTHTVAVCDTTQLTLMPAFYGSVARPRRPHVGGAVAVGAIAEAIVATSDRRPWRSLPAWTCARIATASARGLSYLGHRETALAPETTHCN